VSWIKRGSSRPLPPLNSVLVVIMQFERLFGLSPQKQLRIFKFKEVRDIASNLLPATTGSQSK
jgi:hypothetical protein